MGNCVANRPKIISDLEKPQKQSIYEAFIHQTRTNPQSRKEMLLFQENFCEMFEDVPSYFSDCMLWFLLGFQNNQLNGVEFDTIMQVSEIFILGKSQSLAIPNRIGLIVIMCALYGKLHIQQQLNEFETLEITSIKVGQCIQVFLGMILRKRNINELSLKAYVDAIYPYQNKNMCIQELISYLQQSVPMLEDVIRDYYCNKFLGESIYFKYPTLHNPSHILNQEWVALMYLHFLHKDSNKLELIFTTNIHGNSFELLCQLLTQCKTSLLFVIQCSDESKVYNFGAYTTFEWLDDAIPGGSKEDCLFQMQPIFKIYKTKNDKLTKSQCTYLNSKNDQLKKGIGFGGELSKDFRLFIHSDLKNVSTKNQDKTYTAGELMKNQEAQIETLEIWSIQQIQGTTQIKDIMFQGDNIKMEIEEFDQPQIHLDEDISSYKSGEHLSLNNSFPQFQHKDSCDWEGDSQHEFEEQIIIRDDGFEEVKKEEKGFEVIDLVKDQNQKQQINEKVTSSKQIKKPPSRTSLEDNGFEDVVIQTSDKLDSSALQQVYNVVSGAFGQAEDIIGDSDWNGKSSEWNGKSSEWNGNQSTQPYSNGLSKDLATITEDLKESTNTQN